MANANVVQVPRSQQRQRRGKKNRKHGRNKKWCERYRARGQEAKNKAKRQARHLKRIAASEAKKGGGLRAAS
jgi:hypothetical protein